MEYNSQKDLLIIPEYGRNMQELIRHAFTFEDKEERLAYLKRVIQLMQLMHPQSRNTDDSILKLWQHVIRIAEKDLEVELPQGIEPEANLPTPDNVAYPEEITRFRHYGKNVRTMISKAVEMEEGPIRDGFVRAIATYMKVAYQNWHREPNVNDDIIKGDLISISQSKLTLPDDIFEEPAPQRRKGSNNSYSKRDRDSNNYSRNNRNHRNNNRNRRK